MSPIFISYARSDVEFARKLAHSLSEMGADIWIDVENIPAGMKWSSAIQQGLNVCQVMLLIISPDSMASANVEDEWQYYLDKKKIVIPIWYRPADKHFQLSRLQHIDFHTVSYHIAFDRLLHELQHLGATEPTLGVHRTDDKGIKMVYVPARKFFMGADDISDDEKPIHEVQIPQPFWLDQTPVTNAAYAQFIEAGGYKSVDFWTQSGWEWLQKKKITAPEPSDGITDSQQPRVGISWYEASAYSRWRGGRLPTEAEWEWAARASENCIYPWGNTFDASGSIYLENSGDNPSLVGSNIRSLGASWVGALDMSGNVWEWISSLYKPYSNQIDDDRKNQAASGTRVLHGRSGNLIQVNARAAYRLFDTLPYLTNYFVGFRIVRPLLFEF